MQNNDNFYAAPSAQIHDPYGYGGYGGAQATTQVLLATRGSRLAAVTIDGAIAFVLMMPFFLVMIASGAAFSDSGGGEALAMVCMLGMAVAMVALGVYNLFLLHKNGQTLGKKIMKIKIVRSDLQTPVSLMRIIFMRYAPMSIIGYIPFIGFLVQMANYLWIFGAEQRCLHDMIADTHVIQVTPGMDTTPAYAAQPPMANW